MLTNGVVGSAKRWQSEPGKGVQPNAHNRCQRRNADNAPKGNKVLLSLAQIYTWNKQINLVLETEAALPYCNWSIKLAGIIWFGSTSFDIDPAYVNKSAAQAAGADPSQ